LAVQDPRKARLMAPGFFVGPRINEAAEGLGLSPTTAKRHGLLARPCLDHAFAFGVECP